MYNVFLANEQNKGTYRLLDNPFATIYTGAGSGRHETGRELTTWTKRGNCDTHWNNGARSTITTGPSIEVTNTRPDQVQRKASPNLSDVIMEIML